MLVPPAEDLLKQRQQSIILEPLLKIDFVLLLLDAHFIEDIIVAGDAKFIEVSHHDEVLADISAFQSSRKIVRHKPANQIAAGRDDPTKNMILDFEVTRDGNTVLLHDREHGFPVLPFIKFDLPDCSFLLRIPDRAGMPDIGKRRGFLGGVSQLKQSDELWMLEVQFRDVPIRNQRCDDQQPL